jgi:hypothetical protein
MRSSAESPLGRLVELCPGILPEYAASKLRKTGMSNMRIFGCYKTNAEDEAAIGSVANRLFDEKYPYPEE